jgi:5'-nucleotidase/UDP-sugar diphosphatase
MSKRSLGNGPAMKLAVVASTVLLGAPNGHDHKDPCKPACVPSELCEDRECVPAVVNLRFFFTNDEHGYIEETVEDGGETIRGGAANLMSLLRADGYEPEGDDTLLLSTGDNWEGAPISWPFEGAPAYEVMNLMGYAASALGNHELTGGPIRTEKRMEQADFPYLAANLHWADTGDSPHFVTPYVIREMSGVAVGIVGLTTTRVLDYIHALRFEPFELDAHAAALTAAADMARGEGAELLIAVTHVCQADLRPLASLAAQLGYVALVGGHCHPPARERVSGVELFTPGDYLRNYARLDVKYVRANGHTQTSVAVVDNVRPASAPPPDEPEIQAVVADYRAQLDELYAEPVGFTSAGIPGGWAWHNMVADMWLDRFPDADVAIGDWASMPGSVPPGPVTRGSIYEPIPYNNELILVPLTGAELIESVTCCGPQALAGVTARWSDGGWQVLFDDGTPVDPAMEYQVATHEWWLVVTSMLPWQEKLASVEWTGMDWREPVVAGIAALSSSPSSPLDVHVDPDPRIDEMAGTASSMAARGDQW